MGFPPPCLNRLSGSWLRVAPEALRSRIGLAQRSMFLCDETRKHCTQTPWAVRNPFKMQALSGSFSEAPVGPLKA